MSKGFILSDEVLNHEINNPAYKEKYNFNPKLIQERKLDAMCRKIGYESFRQSEKLKVKDSSYQMLFCHPYINPYNNLM